MPKPPSPARWLLSLALLGACAPASAAAVPGPPASATPLPTLPPARADTGSIVVTGSARIDVPVDRARIRFAVETEAPGAADAVESNARSMTAGMEALRAALGSSGSLETRGYSLTPVYRQPERGSGQDRRIVGYRAQNHIEVTLEDPARVGTVLDAAVGAGINRVSALSFYASDTRAARLAALREAALRAREEAHALADALGVGLGAPLEVRTSAEPLSPPQAVFRTLEAAQVTTPVEAGDQTVRASVTITYRLSGAGGR